MRQPMRTIFSDSPAQKPSVQDQRFSGIATLLEGIVGIRDRVKVNSLISSAVRGDRVEQSLDEAALVFHGIHQSQQQKVLDSLERRIGSIFLPPILEEQGVKEALVLVDFISRTAGHPAIPWTGYSHDGLTELLASIASDKTLSMESSCDRIRLSCAKAVWKLGHTEHGFWAGMVMDPVTRDYAIEKLLDAEHFDGWSPIQANMRIPEVAMKIALSQSPRKVGLIMAAMDGADPTQAIRACAYLLHATEDLQEKLDALASRHSVPMIRKEAGSALKVISVKQSMSSSVEEWLDGTGALLEMFRAGHGHLRDILAEIGSVTLGMGGNRAQQQQASMLLLSMDVAGISVPGSGYSMDFDAP